MHNADSPHATDSHDVNLHFTDMNITLCHRERSNEWNLSVIRTSKPPARRWCIIQSPLTIQQRLSVDITQSQQKPVWHWYQHEYKSLESQQELNTCARTHTRTHTHACGWRRFSRLCHMCSKYTRHCSVRNTKLNDTDITTKGNRRPQSPLGKWVSFNTSIRRSTATAINARRNQHVITHATGYTSHNLDTTEVTRPSFRVVRSSCPAPAVGQTVIQCPVQYRQHNESSVTVIPLHYVGPYDRSNDRTSTCSTRSGMPSGHTACLQPDVCH
jgi:hypothetical protein